MMTISNELSGDIAVAMLGASNTSPGKRFELKETVLKIHSLLQQMEGETRGPKTLRAPDGNSADAVFEAGA